MLDFMYVKELIQHFDSEHLLLCKVCNRDHKFDRATLDREDFECLCIRLCNGDLGDTAEQIKCMDRILPSVRDSKLFEFYLPNILNSCYVCDDVCISILDSVLWPKFDENVWKSNYSTFISDHKSDIIIEAIINHRCSMGVHGYFMKNAKSMDLLCQRILFLFLSGKYRGDMDFYTIFLDILCDNSPPVVAERVSCALDESYFSPKDRLSAVLLIIWNICKHSSVNEEYKVCMVSKILESVLVSGIVNNNIINNNIKGSCR